VLLAGMRRMLRYAVLITVAALIIGIVLTELLSRTIAANTAVIESGMQEFEQGNFRYRIHPTSYDEVGLLGLQLNYMADRIENPMERQKAYEENKRQLELETLQAQINPHFLYNTLGSLKWLAVRGGNKVIASSLDALVKLLRFTIKRAAGMVTVSEEIDYIKSYADIEKMRYDDGFDIEYEVSEDVLNEEIPGFILQPLIENSLLHGLDMTLDDAFIYVRARYQTDNGELFLLIEEEDNGIGMDVETLLSLQSEDRPKKKGFSSIGVSIVSKRLKEIYGDRFHMDIVSSPMQGTRISLWIPRNTAGQPKKPQS
jgi:sensor histidine kinase YesM